MGLIWGTSIKLELRCTNFSNVTDADTDARIKCAVRAYLLYLVEPLSGWVHLCSDKSRTRVSISHVRLFEDLGVVSTYA